MNLNIYTIFDTAAAVGERIFIMRSDGECLRSFQDLCTAADSRIAQHPEHYSLFRIGVYDDNKMAITAQAPECLATGVEMVAKSQQIESGSLNGEDDAEISDGALVQ